MPDYNLGRAHGEISITADTRGAQEAQAAMAATAAEAEVLDKSMGRVNETFSKNRQQTVLSAEAIVRHRQQLEELSRTSTRYHDDYQRAVNRTKEAEDALNRVRDDEDVKTGARLRLANDVQKARDAEERALLRADQAYARYQSRLQTVTHEIENFNRAHIEASSGINRMRLRMDELGEAIEKISSKMGSLLRIVGTGGIMGLFVGASSGTTAAFGAGGLSGLTSLMAGVMEMVQQLSGVIALLPAVATAAGVGLGTLAVGLHGISQAFSSMGDVNKFIDALKELSPAARQAMEIIYSFSDAMRGARQVVQQSLFAPIIADIQPLIQTWLPQLMRAGQQVGNQFGQMGHQIAQFMLQPQTVAAFNTFIQNMVRGMEAVRGAINPVLEAWRTLTTVGSTFFPRIGEAIKTIATEFNNWVQSAANSGKLQAWINSALTAFTDLGHVALNTFEALGNILSIGDKYGGGFLAFLRNLSEEFKNWTVSDKGRETLSSFFQLIQQAGAAVHPILKELGSGIATVAGALTRLGIQIAPAVTQFFTDIVGALKGLGPTIQQLGPSISQFLVAFGQALAQAVSAAGPELPKFFAAMSEALIALLPLLPEAVKLITGLLSHLTPGEIQGILLAAGGIRLLAGAFSLLTAALDLNPIVLAIGAIALLGAGVVAAVTNFHGFGDAVSNALKPLGDLANQAFDWGKNLLNSFINGIGSMLGKLGDVAHGVAETITDLWKPGSPTKRGPLSDISTEEMGARLTSGYAAGIAGGTPAVDAASTGVAGAAAGTTGLGFSTAGLSGKSGQGVSGATGNSGFDRYIKFITDDMQAWSNIFQQSFQLVQSGINTAIQGIKVVASIWGRGDNPLTRPGGIAGPQIGWGQQHVPGVPDVQIPGKAPIPALAPLGGPPPVQQDVPGVPSVGPHGQKRGPVFGPPAIAGPAPANPPASVQGQAPTAAPAGAPPITVNPDGTISSPNPEWQKLLTRESNGRNVLQGDIPGDPNVGANKAQGYFQITPETWRSNGGEEFAPNPMAATAQQQAIIAGRIFAARGGQPWGAVPGGGRENEDLLRAGLGPATNTFATPQASAGAPGSAIFGQQRPGVEQNTGGQRPRPAAENISSIIQTLFPQIQTIGGVHPDALPYHPSGHALDIMIPQWDTPEGKQLGQQINDFLQQNAQALGISDTIFNRTYYKAGEPATPYEYSGSDPDQAHFTHVHVTTLGPGGGGGDEPGNFQRNIAQLQGLPPAFAQRIVPPPPAPTPTAPSGPSLPPGLSSGVGVAGAAAGIGAGLLSVEALRRLGSRVRTSYLQSNFDYYDAKAKLDIVRSMSPDEIAAAGLTSPDQITFGEPGAGFTPKGLTTEVGRVPTGPANIAARVAGGGGPTLGPINGPFAPQQLLRPGERGFGQILQPPPGSKPIDVNIAADGGAAQEAGGLSRAIGIGGKLLGPGLAAAGALPFALDAARNIAGNQVTTQPTWGDLLSGRRITGPVSTGTTESPISQGIPQIGGGGPSRNAGLPSEPQDPKKIPQSTVDMAAAAGHPIPGTTPSSGLPGGKATPAPPAAATSAPTWVPGKGFVDSSGKEVPGPGATPAQVQEFNRQQSSQPVALRSQQQPRVPGQDLATGAVGATQPAAARPTTPVAPGQPNIPGTPGGQGSMDYKAVYDQSQAGGSGVGGVSKLPFNAQTPLDAFSSGMASAGNVATDAFTIFNDVIQNITATANITDKLSRGIANTEDIVGIIQNFQTYLKTAADVAHLVSDVGGVVAGAGAGDPTGGAGAVGGGIQAIGALVQSAIEGVNQVITIGIEVYHEVGKYAGFIMGEFLGGPNTGPLGGNVRMVLNTNTNQLYTYSEDNPLNKNLFNVPRSQQGYLHQVLPQVQQSQVNIYTGPGQTPAGMMQESMWMIGTGAAPVASVAGRN